MTTAGAGRAETFCNPLPGVSLGDPFVLRHRGRFYLYGTNDGPPLPDGRVIPVYRSDDMIHWTPLGGALIPDDPAADHWAPEVLAWNGRFFMVVSFGDVERRGHALWVAAADAPEGPFTLERRVNDPAEKFAIDGSWLLDDDGRLYLFHCADFVAEDDPPHGTGIVVQPMRDPLTPEGPRATVIRAHSPWQVFEANRTMPLYEGRRFAAWTTVEGPAPVRRCGRYYCGYSGGNYTGAYGTGEVVADGPLGPYEDLRGREGPLFATTPSLVEGPGHFSVVQPDLVHDWIVLHGRVPGEPVRRVWLCPASWGGSGVSIGELTTRPQLPPQLPAHVSRFAGHAEAAMRAWSFPSGCWSPGPDGLHHEGATPGLAWREDVALASDWAAEIFVRFPEAGCGQAGLVTECEAGRLRVVVEAAGGGRVVVEDADGAVRSLPLPRPGDEAFRLSHLQALTVRSSRGRVSVRLGGFLLADGLQGAVAPARFGLHAAGPAVVDAVSLAVDGGSGT